METSPQSEWESLTKDEKVKKLLVLGSGKLPIVSDDEEYLQVSIGFSGKLQENSEIVEEESLFSFILGANEVIKGWEVAIRSMKLREKSLFFISSDYAFGEEGRCSSFKRKEIPKDSSLFYEIELKSAQILKKTPWDFPENERREKSSRLKSQGNNLVKMGEIPHAKSAYFSSLSWIERELNEESQKLKLALFLNLSLVSLKLQEAQEAKTFAEEALKIDQNNTKGHYRLAQALSALRQYEMALKEIDTAMELDPLNQDILKEKQSILLKVSKN